jgi:hypothetical protein
MLSIAQNNIRRSFNDPLHSYGFSGIILLRCLLFLFVSVALNSIFDIGINSFYLSSGAAIGVLLGSLLSFSGIKQRGFLVLIGSILLLYWIVWTTALLVPRQNVFQIYNLKTVADLVIACLLFGAVTTWLFWRHATYIMLEILVLVGLCLSMFADHRNYRLTLPQTINDLAWTLGIDYLNVLVLIGAFFVFCLTIFWMLSSSCRLDSRQSLAGGPRIFSGSPSPLHVGAAILALSIIVIIASTAIYHRYHLVAQTRTAHGVGQETGEQLSPLQFHSALGSTNQPAALVRLETDYPDNPFTPMLYLRESALSAFNGREMVIGEKGLNDDVSFLPPEAAYDRNSDKSTYRRRNITQSIFTLTNHQQAFGIDFPESMRRLENPQKSRFRDAYRVQSMAPTYSLDTLKKLAVGNDSWTAEEMEHFLVAHEDGRYRELAQKITEGLESPIEKAFAITDYLSRNSIYTLTPGHVTGPNEDPVAPYLFGDLRGYCVHFAHATVYLLRALRIPARIATGYLTDLSDSRDGHILLRMSDRHAWAEVYIRGKGWVPFDTQPDQVESHADIEVDAGLLEELMGLLGPGEEILPDSSWLQETGLKDVSGSWFFLNASSMVTLFLLAVFLLVTIKTYLIFCWRLPGPSKKRIKRGYIAACAILFDRGLRRQPGETREEFAERIMAATGIDICYLSYLINKSSYASNDTDYVDKSGLNGFLNAQFKGLFSLPGSSRLLSILKPGSTFAFITGRKW